MFSGGEVDAATCTYSELVTHIYYTSIYTAMRMYICTYMHICMYIGAHTQNTHLYHILKECSYVLLVCIHVSYSCTYIYIYTYVYTYVYKHICIYMYMHTCMHTYYASYIYIHIYSVLLALSLLLKRDQKEHNTFYVHTKIYMETLCPRPVPPTTQTYTDIYIQTMVFTHHSVVGMDHLNVGVVLLLFWPKKDFITKFWMSAYPSISVKKSAALQHAVTHAATHCNTLHCDIQSIWIIHLYTYVDICITAQNIFMCMCVAVCVCACVCAHT